MNAVLSQSSPSIIFCQYLLLVSIVEKMVASSKESMHSSIIEIGKEFRWTKLLSFLNLMQKEKDPSIFLQKL